MFNNATVQYREDYRPMIKDGYTDILKEASSYFADQGIQMTTAAGMEEILAEAAYFQEYKQRLLQGLPTDQVDIFNQLMENTRMGILQEANVAGITQIAGLAMPTIRKMWAKVSLKHAIPTEAVKAPRFTISYTRAFIMTPDGRKYELPDGINAMNNELAEMPHLRNPEGGIPVGIEDFNLFSLAPYGHPWNHSDPALAGTNPRFSKDKFDTINRDFEITHVVFDPAINSDAEPVAVSVNAIPDMQKNFFIQVTHPRNPEITDTLFGRADFQAGILTTTAMRNYISHFYVRGFVSQEKNDYGDSVSFDIITKDVDIGVGVHLNAPLPIEWLQDTMAMYSIDGAAEVIDLLSQTTAQKLEQEIYVFLVNSYNRTNARYHGEFNMMPSAGFAGRPKEWREELKTVIDFFAIKMKTEAKFHGGKFVIIGNPLDMHILPNVDWVFNHTNDTMAGVDVSFNLGAFSGANRYELVSSDLIPNGAFLMFFVPGIDRLLTYKYFPYTFNVEKGYRDPNFPNVPSIMTTKRHTIEEFSPLICRIDILNNLGNVPHHRPLRHTALPAPGFTGTNSAGAAMTAQEAYDAHIAGPRTQADEFMATGRITESARPFQATDQMAGRLTPFHGDYGPADTRLSPTGPVTPTDQTPHGGVSYPSGNSTMNDGSVARGGAPR